jgi:hypothetical protein
MPIVLSFWSFEGRKRDENPAIFPVNPFSVLNISISRATCKPLAILTSDIDRQDITVECR